MADRGAGQPGLAPRASDVHVVIPTHTSRHLDVCLASMGWQVRPPDTVVVSCDTDEPSIAATVERWWPRIASACRARAPRLVLVMRPHQKQARLNQVRNNALRALDDVAAPAERDLIVVLDGDTLLAALGFELIIPYRINLDQARTAALDPARLLEAAAAGGDPLADLATPPEWQALAERHRRYLRHLRLKQTALPGLPKAHKPKILGGHHAVSVRCLRAVNGYDEQYTGYGYDDDDLSRRLHALSPAPRTAIAVSEILAFHLWHPSRAPARPTEAPGYARFSRPGLPVEAEHGWRNPIPQPEPRIRVIEPAVSVKMAHPAAVQRQRR